MRLFLLALKLFFIQSFQKINLKKSKFTLLKITNDVMLGGVPSLRVVSPENAKAQNTISNIWKFKETINGGMDDRFYLKNITEPTVFNLQRLYETNELLKGLKQNKPIYLQPNIELEQFLNEKIEKVNWITKMNNDFFGFTENAK
jgi:hypothetical protein